MYCWTFWQYLHCQGFMTGLSISTGSHSTVGNVSGYRCVSDCRSRGASSIPARSHTFVEIDHEIISMVILPPSTEWIIQEGFLSVTSKSMCTKYWLTACSSLPRKKCGKVNWRSRNDHSCWLGRKTTKQTNKQANNFKLHKRVVMSFYVLNKINKMQVAG